MEVANPSRIGEILSAMNLEFNNNPEENKPLLDGVCPDCGDTGFKENPTSDGRRTVSPCSCRREAAIRAAVGEHFYEKSKTFDSYELRSPSQARALEKIKSNPDGSHLLWGDHGVGKTHLLACQYSWAMHNRPAKSCMFVSDTDIAESIMASIKDSAKAPILSPDWIKKCDSGFHIFIREFGKTIWRPIIQEHLFAIIDAIYNRWSSGNTKFGLSLATNEPPDIIAKTLDDLAPGYGFGGGLMRRIGEMTGGGMEVREDK